MSSWISSRISAKPPLVVATSPKSISSKFGSSISPKSMASSSLDWLNWKDWSELSLLAIISSKLDEIFAMSKSESISEIFVDSIPNSRPDSIPDSSPDSISEFTSKLRSDSCAQLASRSSGNKESSSTLFTLAIAEASVEESSVSKSVENSPKSWSMLDSSLLGLLILAPSRSWELSLSKSAKSSLLSKGCTSAPCADICASLDSISSQAASKSISSFSNRIAKDFNSEAPTFGPSICWFSLTSYSLSIQSIWSTGTVDKSNASSSSWPTNKSRLSSGTAFEINGAIDWGIDRAIAWSDIVTRSGAEISGLTAIALGSSETAVKIVLISSSSLAA